MEKTFRTAAIICEYNPFHYGHMHQIKVVKESAGLVVGIMSGDFVQRGDVAVAGKYSRAAAAVDGGMDLVLELPFPYCLASASDFAAAGVRLAAAVGADALAFGCEDPAESLLPIAHSLADGTLKTRAPALIAADKTLSYPRALQAAAAEQCGAASAAAMQKPNNILACEYLAAIESEHLPLQPIFVKRDGRYRSSSDIRSRKNMRPALPFPAHFAERRSLRYAERAVLYALRTSTDGVFYGVDASLAARIKAAACASATLDELVGRVTCKQYTAARVRRAALAVWLKISADAVKAPPCFTNLLAANKRGLAFLRSRSGAHSLPVITKPADYKNRPGIAPVYEAAVAAAECAALCCPVLPPYGSPFRGRPYIV